MQVQPCGCTTICDCHVVPRRVYIGAIRAEKGDKGDDGVLVSSLYFRKDIVIIDPVTNEKALRLTPIVGYNNGSYISGTATDITKQDLQEVLNV